MGMEDTGPEIEDLTSQLRFILAVRYELEMERAVPNETLARMFELGGAAANSAASIDLKQIASVPLSLEEVDSAIARIVNSSHVRKLEEKLAEGLNKTEGSLQAAKAAKLAVFRYGLNFSDELTKKIDDGLSTSEPDSQFEAELAAAKFEAALKDSGIEGVNANRVFLPEGTLEFQSGFDHLLLEMKGAPSFPRYEKTIDAFAEIAVEYLKNPDISEERKQAMSIALARYPRLSKGIAGVAADFLERKLQEAATYSKEVGGAFVELQKQKRANGILAVVEEIKAKTLVAHDPWKLKDTTRAEKKADEVFGAFIQGCEELEDIVSLDVVGAAEMRNGFKSFCESVREFERGLISLGSRNSVVTQEVAEELTKEVLDATYGMYKPVLGITGSVSKGEFLIVRPRDLSSDTPTEGKVVAVN